MSFLQNASYLQATLPKGVIKPSQLGIAQPDRPILWLGPSNITFFGFTC